MDRSAFAIKKVIGTGEFGRVSQAIFTNANGKLVEVGLHCFKNNEKILIWDFGMLWTILYRIPDKVN